MDFSETIVVYDFKPATDDRRDKKFLLTSKLYPLGAVCSLPWGIHVLNNEKSYIKSDFKEISLKLVTNGQGLSVAIKILSPGAVCPCSRAT